ncbi:methyltransferase domain-containing protein [Cryptosporangium phraense]|uniref:Methyltransferase domain-containing protein n=1 Tax=Cryptosporangium phraense TaxID=2593070 RepID=A0A545AP75_9ACTN|nr:methyltransferase domain-containing protein [Cryptosporangium phraense]
MVGALGLYDEALWTVASGGSVALERWEEAGTWTPLPLADWCSDRVDGDRALVARCVGSTLDVGCGPGRLTAALSDAAVGGAVLGVDVSAAAVALTRRRGAAAVRASVFGPLPAEGHWDTVLLADGNVGIGGDAVALLRRCRALLAPAGRIVVELDPRPSTEASRTRLRLGDRRSEFFGWARVGPDAIDAIAGAAGLVCGERGSEAGRCFSVLTSR